MDLNRTLQDIEIFYANQDKPLLERDFPAWVKRSFLRSWLRPEAKERADETIRFLTQRFLNELVAQKDAFALEIVKKAEEAAKAAAETTAQA